MSRSTDGRVRSSSRHRSGMRFDGPLDSGPVKTAAVTDGRTARRNRNRDAVLDADDRAHPRERRGACSRGDRRPGGRVLPVRLSLLRRSHRADARSHRPGDGRRPADLRHRTSSGGPPRRAHQPVHLVTPRRLPRTRTTHPARRPAQPHRAGRVGRVRQRAARSSAAQLVEPVRSRTRSGRGVRARARRDGARRACSSSRHSSSSTGTRA